MLPLAISLLFAVIPVAPGGSTGTTPTAGNCAGSSVNLQVDNGSCQKTGLPVVSGGSGELQLILQVAFAILGAVAVLFVVIGGLRYAISDGDPEDMSKAKNTIIYAIVGLVIVLFAEAIVTFALGFLK